MILHNKLLNSYELCTIRTEIPLNCDYCGKEFKRVKKSIQKLNKHIQKDSCGSKECSQKKREETFLLRYGVNNPGKTDSSIKKNKERKYFSTVGFKEKRKQTLLKKYGVSSPLKNKETLLKQKKTCLEKYGVENFSQTRSFKERVKTIPNKKDFIEKREKTSIERYGVKNYTQTEQYKIKSKETCLKKYGVDHPSKSHLTRKKAKETNLRKYGETNYAKTKEFKKRYSETCLERYGVANPLLLQQNQVYGKTQKEIKEWLKSMGFSFETSYSILLGKEIDLYDDKSKTAVEYCGLFWHNELSPEPRKQNYHYEKHISCRSKGIRLITIFEDEWKNKKELCESRIKSILGICPKIYARNCLLRECSKKEFREFCKKYHMQEGNNLGLTFYGLFYENQLVGGMSLGRHHRNKKTLVLDRLCFKSNLSIVGGASKLFKACKNWAVGNKYKEIVSWSDNRWSCGRVYESLGFVLDEELGPDYQYVNFKGPKKRISKQSQKKSNTKCPDNMTEKEYALQNGLARIWDCGKKRWKFKL